MVEGSLESEMVTRDIVSVEMGDLDRHMRKIEEVVGDYTLKSFLNIYRGLWPPAHSDDEAREAIRPGGFRA